MARQDNWEDQWQRALQNASVDPPEEVWKGISQNLDRKSRKGFLFMWLTAASLSVLAAAGVLYLESTRIGDISKDNKDNISSKIDEKGFNEDHQSEFDYSLKDKSLDEVEIEKSVSQNGRVSTTIFDENGAARIPLEGDNTFMSTSESDSDFRPKQLLDGVIPALIKGLDYVSEELKLPEIKEIWGVPRPYYRKKPAFDNSWYAGLGFSSGMSMTGSANEESPVNGLLADDFSASSIQAPISNDIITSTVVGLSIGKKISEKIILETGLSYMQMNSSSTSSVVFRGAMSSESAVYNTNADAERGTLSVTSPYEIINQYQFVSIPVETRFLILDRKWKVGLSAGMSGDYFFRTRSEDATGLLSSYEAAPASDDAWNDLNLSVLGGFQISRELGDNYTMAITPQIRRTITSLSNNSADFQPLIVQVGVRLNYQFK